MFWRTLKVLMWKHAVVRERKYLYTIMEITAPLLLFIFLFLLKNNIVPPRRALLDISLLANTEVLDLVQDTEGPLKNILYYPNTTFTDALMREVGKNLDLRRVNRVPSKSYKGYYAYTKPSDLHEFIRHMEIGDAVIIFGTDLPAARYKKKRRSIVYNNQKSPELNPSEPFEYDDDYEDDADDPDRNMLTIQLYNENETGQNKGQSVLQSQNQVLALKEGKREKWPISLNYTIRMKQNFETGSYRTSDHGPHTMFGLEYMKFMRIQWAVDTSFIKLRSGRPINQTVYMQEFPFYKRADLVSILLMISLIIPCCYLSLILPFVFLMTRLLEERASGIQELIKMMGVSYWTLALSHFLNVIPVMLIFCTVVTLLLTITSNPFIANINSIVLILPFLLLYFNTIIALAFVCSYIVRNAEYGVTLAVLAYSVSLIPTRFLQDICDESIPYALTLASGILPHMPLFWFWNMIARIEHYGHVAFFAAYPPCVPSMFFVFLFLILQAILFYLLAYYLSLVRPGKYGQALPWDFMCQKRYWGKEPSALRLHDAPVERDERYFEKPPENQEVGIKIKNVSKAYGQNMVLNNVNMKVYRGEITVLLGHNGAGKTTLMNIITGMTSASKGKVYVNNLDTVKQQKEVRKHIGLCPQHNMFFSDLTLLEHIVFFTMLRRGTFAEAGASSRKLGRQLGLGLKLNDMCADLSGGMKRRAQLACALAGNATVLVLDEPTSGLDVETRRDLWDLLLAQRGTRTVLLSTHFMEEADALGDRVAALHSGVLRCFATPMHLKRAVGDGYRLTLTTDGTPNEASITEAVQRQVPAATLKERTINSVSYNLPSSASTRFSDLFTDLEARRTELGIDSIGLGVSTLEEVFFKLCSDVDTTRMEEEVEAITPEGKEHHLKGIPLYTRQFCVLFRRQLQFVNYRKLVFLILQVIVPIVLLIIVTHGFNNHGEEPSRVRLRMDLDMYSDIPGRQVLYTLDFEKTLRMRSFDYENPGVTFRHTNNIAEYLARIAIDRTDEYYKYLVGIEQVNDTDAKILYTTTVRHAAPVALNLLTNLLLKQYLNSETSEIHTYNEPVEGYTRQRSDKTKTKHSVNLVTYCLFVVFLFQATIMHSASLPCRERETGSRHIHIMSGCPAELYWFTTLIFHMLITILLLIIPIIVIALILERDNTINAFNFLLALAILLFVDGLALLAFIYLTTFFCNERYTNIVHVACLFAFGIIFPLVRYGADVLEETTDQVVDAWWMSLLSICWYIVPYYTASITTLNLAKRARINALCEELKSNCPDMLVTEAGWDDNTEDRCCGGLTPKPYHGFESGSPIFGMLMLFVQFCFFMTMVMLAQRGVFNSLCDWLMNRNYKPSAKTDPDPTVREEKAYVQEEIKKPAKEIKQDSILVADVHKNYVNFLQKKKVNAVRGLNLSVKRGECFGLLGVNGAGKSTAFKMLTDEECTTRGRIFGNGFHHKRGHHQYLRTLGYCPQFFGLDMFLTGNQNLRLILTLRGLTEQRVKSEVASWISIVGLEKYANRRAEKYSGGCQRRLSAASALCGGAATVLLDEPSAGVDVAARRRLWVALRKALKQRRSIIITSHSMDEMESLCARIAIMCKGRVRALGSPAALRKQHATGHAVVFKIKPEEKERVDGVISEVNVLKGTISEKFNCTLKDEHRTMLHYHINETMRYSDLFAKLEELKRQYPSLIEDYSVTDTTLEEVFLALAQENKDDTHEV